MKRWIHTIRKKLAFTISLIILIGLLPLNTVMANENRISLSTSGVVGGVAVTLKNGTSSVVNANIHFAVYDELGRMNEVQTFHTEAVAPGESSLQHTFLSDQVANTSNSFRLFVWDYITHAPLMDISERYSYIVVDGSNVVYDGKTVSGDADVASFMCVKLDSWSNRGTALVVTKTGESWTSAKAYGVNLIIASKPDNLVGSALPKAEMSILRIPEGGNSIRIVVTP